MEKLDEVFKWQMGEKLAAGSPYVWSQQKEDDTWKMKISLSLEW